MSKKEEEVIVNELGTITPLQFHERKRWVFLGLPFTFTKYHIIDEMITIDSGVFNRTEDDCYMYKVRDVKLEQSFWERLAGLGTVVCYTGDTTHQLLKLQHIKHAKDVKNFILRESEEQKIKRRVINTMELSAAGAGIGEELEDM